MDHPGPVAVDCSALQSPTSRGRGIGRYAAGWALAIESLRPDLVACYLLNPDLPPPGELEGLLATGKVTYRGSDTLPAGVRGLHLLSALDPEVSTDVLWPSAINERGLRLTATVYDCIPALDPDTNLADLGERRAYRTRLEVLRAADQLHVLSSAVGRDLVRLLGIDPERVVRVGGAPDPRFRPPASREAARDLAIAAFADQGLRRPYVLYPSGSHPRKNNERLVRAWARLPRELRRSHQLVLTGEFPEPMRHHLAVVASSLDGAEELVLPGYLDDAAMVHLAQGAALVCVPSLAEGYGLPIAEALACGTPVVASDRPPFDELVGAEWRFDPDDEQAIATAVGAALVPHGPIPAMASPPSWSQVAAASAAGFDELYRRPPRVLVRPRPRPRVAFVTPLPPAATGTAAYGFRLAEELAATGEVDLDLYVDGSAGRRPDRYEAPAGLRIRSVHGLEGVEALAGGYHEVLYTVGNSHHHLGALAMLRRRPGLVLAHDIRLTNLYRHEHGDPGLLPGGFQQTLRRLYGDGLAEGLGSSGGLDDEETERFGLLMAREIIGSSRGFLVTSPAAAALARADAGPELGDRIAVVPFALEAPRGDTDFAEEAWTPQEGPPLRGWGAGPERPDERAVIAHFGIVDRAKQPQLLIEALASLRSNDRRPLLAFVGPVSPALCGELVAAAEREGVREDLRVTGAVPALTYRAWLDRATLAVQLRAAFHGEASAAVGECLASGLPTVVSNLGWARELPDDAVAKVPVDVSVDALAAELGSLLDIPERRRRLGERALDHAARHGFAHAAHALVEVLLASTREGFSASV